MIRKVERRLEEALQDSEGIERASIAAAREVIRVHRSFGHPVIVADEKGQPLELHVDEFERNVNQREAELNRQFGRVPPEEA